MGWTKVQEENKDPQFLGGVSGVLTVSGLEEGYGLGWKEHLRGHSKGCI